MAGSFPGVQGDVEMGTIWELSFTFLLDKKPLENKRINILDRRVGEPWKQTETGELEWVSSVDKNHVTCLMLSCICKLEENTRLIVPKKNVINHQYRATVAFKSLLSKTFHLHWPFIRMSEIFYTKPYISIFTTIDINLLVSASFTLICIWFNCLYILNYF